MRSLPVLLATAWIATSTAQTPCVNGFAGPYPCSNIDLLAQMSLAQLGTVTNVADIWGWTDPLTGKEYAIVGGRTGTSFVDLSVPTAPVLTGFLPSHGGVSSLWRDVDTHGNWCFVGSEAAGHGLQVFDLTRLRNPSQLPLPLSLTEDAHFGTFGNSHTIFADKSEPYVYAVGTNLVGGGLVVVNVSNPLAPTLAGTLSSQGYIHENSVYTYHGPDGAHVGRKISFNFHINANDRVTIVDVTEKTDMQLIGTTPPYTIQSLCHQGWLTEDHRFLLMNDEGDEGVGATYNTRTHIFNIENLEAPVHIGFFSGPNPSYDHNLYVHRGLVWEANYTSGLHVLDAADVENANLQMVAWFDTYTLNNNRSYNGAWGNYPFFQSGIVVVSSYGEGLFVLRPRLSVRVKALLDGPYDAGTEMMHDSLRVKGLLPLSEPYTGLGYAHVGGGGETTTPGVLAITGANAIVDWVVLELRDASEPSIIVATHAALLQRDGDIVGTDGTSPVQFNLPPNDYHIAVRHRNHLAVMTDAPVDVSVATRTYDLTDGSTSLYGTEAAKTIDGANVLWAGNCLSDGTLRYTGANNDRDPILIQIGGTIPTATTSGYLPTDANMDGTVRYVGAHNDRDPILISVGGSIPTNTRAQQLP
ncbi:MAG: choice-of-anchor B family protein [Flavobacteriales bacterium]|nr:choice-of-anchor B family protein [Flavobacteriales bacterium]